jgi:hypothetical protein
LVDVRRQHVVAHLRQPNTQAAEAIAAAAVAGGSQRCWQHIGTLSNNAPHRTAEIVTQ